MNPYNLSFEHQPQCPGSSISLPQPLITTEPVCAFAASGGIVNALLIGDVHNNRVDQLLAYTIHHGVTFCIEDAYFDDQAQALQ